jgi:hypothetical protein
VKRVLATALLILGIAAPAAAADTQHDPLRETPYTTWLSTAAPRVPQPQALYAVHHHVTDSPCGSQVVGCTNGLGTIWIRQYETLYDYAGWRRIFHHEVGHNVDRQHFLDGHRDHFRDLIDACCFWPEQFGDGYAQCALNGGPLPGYSWTTRNAVCGWLERFPRGVRYHKPPEYVLVERPR